MTSESITARLDKTVSAAVEAGLAALEAARDQPYYDEAADQSSSDRYF